MRMHNGQNGKNLALFDWSGVLSDDRLPVYETVMRMFDQLKLKRMHYDVWIKKTSYSAAQFCLEQAKAQGKPQSDTPTYDTLDELFIEIYPQVLRDGCRPTMYPAAKDVLRTLRAHKHHIVIVSSHPQVNLEVEAADYGLDDLIHVIHGGSRDKAADITGSMTLFKPRFAAFVGDMVSDTQAAHKAGIASIALTTGYHDRARLAAERPTYIFDTLADVLSIFT